MLRLDFAVATFESFAVFAHFGRIFVSLALIAVLGGQWAMLQTVAWTTMLANNLQTGSFHEAVAKTFDGQHPCPLCRAIAAGKQSEKKNSFAQSQKLEFTPFKGAIALLAPSRPDAASSENIFLESLPQKPLTPPPRWSFI
ncbi:MAG TPA: hypothetical protein VGI03_02205 [Verrucomicrobiae bacterium]|jgi:hypothetical protein